MLIGHEIRVSRSGHKGHGSGGMSFNGHRGLVWCRDCGHVWATTLVGVMYDGRVRVRAWVLQPYNYSNYVVD